MRYGKIFKRLTLAVGMALMGSTALMAQDWRREGRDLRNDHENIEQLRANIARDHWRLNQDIRAGREWAASDDARDLARDQRTLAARLRDVRHEYRERDEYWRGR